MLFASKAEPLVPEKRFSPPSELFVKMRKRGTETMLINKLKLALMVVVVADIIGLIFEYKLIYIIILSCGWSTYDVFNIG